MRPLNLDILAMVVREMNSRDALALSTTCRSIHHVVLRKTLESVVISSSRMMQTFPEFVLKDPDRRMPLIRSLAVESDALEGTFKNAAGNLCERDTHDHIEEELAFDRAFALFLAQVFTHARNLRSLTLDNSSYWLVRFPELQDAFVEMDCLTKLTLDEPCEVVMGCVADMRSSLRFLMLDCPLYGTETVDPPSYFDGMINQRKLETVYLRVEPENITWTDGVEAQWPTVRTLNVMGYTPMKPFVNAFPNVRSLHLDNLEEYNHDDLYDPTVQWASLDYLNGSPDQLLKWEIRCPVRWLKLGCTIRNNPQNDSWALREQEDIFDVIRFTKPTILSLSTETSGVGLTFWKQLGSVTGNVKLLELELDVIDAFEEPHAETWMMYVAQMLGFLQVPCLTICISTSRLMRQAEHDLKLRAATAGLQDLLARSMPKLQFIAIAGGPFQDDGDGELDGLVVNTKIYAAKERTWWQVCKSKDEEASTELITRWDGERLRERLHGMGYEELSSLGEISLSL